MHTRRMIPLSEWMRQHHGVAHSSTVRLAGYDVHAVRTAIASGAVTRVRRSWLVGRECSGERRQAAQAGGRVSCITAARELGLWTPDATHTHIAVPGTASRIRNSGLIVHWARGPIAVPSRSAEEPLLNVLFHAARCLEPERAVLIWESALHGGLVSAGQLQRVAWHSGRATRIAEVASSLSDSGLETRFLWIMREIGVVVQQQIWIDGHPVDALIGERLVIQSDGFAHHSTAKDRRRDLSADARLTLLGYTVLRFDYHQLLFDPVGVQSTIRMAMAQGLHLQEARKPNRR